MSVGRKLSDSEVVRLENNIVERYESIKGQLVQLQGTLDTMEAQWRGIGANAFNTKQVEINGHMKQIGNLLMWFLENLNLTRKDKDNLEDELDSTIKSINVDLGGSASAVGGSTSSPFNSF
jgi:uncharacterized protein YukE